MSSGTTPKTVISEAYSIPKGKSFVVISMEIKCLKNSRVSYLADVMKPEGTKHKKVKSHLVLMHKNKSFTIIKNSFYNTLIHVHLFPGDLKL